MFDCLLCLAGLYVEGAVGYVNPMGPLPKGVLFKFEPNHVANPMGRIAIGHEWESGKFRYSLEIRHESWIGTTADVGLESAWVEVRWRPFK